MSQTFNTNTPLTTSGSQLASQMDARSDALLTLHSGAARPPYAKEGTLWLKNDVDPRLLYFYDGSTDVLFAQVSGGGVLTLSDAGLARLSSANVFTARQTIRRSGAGGHLVLEDLDTGKLGTFEVDADDNRLRLFHNMDGAGNQFWEFPSSTETPTANTVMRKADVDAISPLDDPTFADNSPSRPPTQQSAKAYIDTAVAALPFSQAYTSTQQTITSGGVLTLPHGLGVVPDLVQLRLVFVGAESGFAVGDIIHATADFNADATNNMGVTVKMDATNVTIYYGTDSRVFKVLNPSGTRVELINSNVRLIVKAWS